MSSADHHSHQRNDVPLPILIVTGVFLSIVVAFAILAKSTGIGAMAQHEFESTDSVLVRFTDEAAGGIGVYDHETGTQLLVYAAEDTGFVRTAMRAMAFDRQRLNIGSQAPFEVIRTVENQLLLIDPSTGNRVTLNAFGSANSEDFARVFEPASQDNARLTEEGSEG